MEIDRSKLASFIIGIIVVFLIIFLLYNVKTIRDPLSKFLGIGQSDQTNTTINTNETIPFYDEFVKSHTECKLNPETECYCQINYLGTPEFYLIQIVNERETTTFTLYKDSGIDYSIFDTSDPKDEPITVQPLKGPIEIKNDVLYFVNNRPNIFAPGTSVPKTENGKLNIRDFTLIHLQFAYEEYIYSMKNVAGENRINAEKGLALYKFDNKKSAFFPLEETKNIKKCKKLDSLDAAYQEFNRLVLLTNACINANRGECQYIPNIPRDYSIIFENKKFTLRHQNTEIISSDETNKNPCLFTDFRRTSKEDVKPLTTQINFNDYEQVSMHPIEDNLCFLPYTTDLVQQRRLAEERSRIGVNQPIVPS